MNKKFFKILEEKEFKDFKNLELEFDNYVPLSAFHQFSLGFLLIHTVIIAIYFINLPNKPGILGLLLIYIMLAPSIAFIYLILIGCIFYDLSGNLLLPLYKTNPSKRLRGLKTKYSPIEQKLIKHIEKYINIDSVQLLEKAKEIEIGDNAKMEFIENYLLLKDAQTKIKTVYGLSEFLEYCKICIEEFKHPKIKNKIIEEPNKLPDTKRNFLNNKFEKTDHRIEKENALNQKINIVPIKNINWKSINDLKHDIGLLGEEVVLEYEKNKLAILKLHEYLPRIEQVSKTIGDGLGYDIKSFDKYGNQIYIEVKSTTRGMNRDIIFTKNELEQMKVLGNYYMLYRIYELDLKTKSCQIEIFEGAKSIMERYEFITSTVKGKLKT